MAADAESLQFDVDCLRHLPLEVQGASLVLSELRVEREDGMSADSAAERRQKLQELSDRSWKADRERILKEHGLWEAYGDREFSRAGERDDV